MALTGLPEVAEEVGLGLEATDQLLGLKGIVEATLLHHTCKVE